MLTAELGREPTDEELAAEVELPVSRCARCARPRARSRASTSRSARSEDTSLGELFAERRAGSPRRSWRSACEREALRQRASPSCRSREREIVRLRYGLDGDGRPQSVEQVVRSARVSRAEVRQIEHSALERLGAARARWKRFARSPTRSCRR